MFVPARGTAEVLLFCLLDHNTVGTHGEWATVFGTGIEFTAIVTPAAMLQTGG